MQKEYLPSWIDYPEIAKTIVKKRGITNLWPWRILTSEESFDVMKEFDRIYPGKEYIPFARYRVEDDFACWRKADLERIIIVHGWTSSGWETSGKEYDYEDFGDWLINGAIEDMKSAIADEVLRYRFKKS